MTLGKLGNDEVKVRVLHSARRPDHRDRHPAGQGVGCRDRRVQRARHVAGARPGAARGRGHPLLLDHLRGRGRHREAGTRASSPRCSARSSWATRRSCRSSRSRRLGKVAGCRITEGVVKRGCRRAPAARRRGDPPGRAQHPAPLQGRRAAKWRNGYECGMSFANYDDMRVATRSSASRSRRWRRERLRLNGGRREAAKGGAARRPSGSCAWRRKSATCLPACSRAGNSATPTWPGNT